MGEMPSFKRLMELPFRRDIYEAHNMLTGGGRAYGGLQKHLIIGIMKYFPAIDPCQVVDIGATSHSTRMLALGFSGATIVAISKNPSELEAVRYMTGLREIDLTPYVSAGRITQHDAHILGRFYEVSRIDAKDRVETVESAMTDIGELLANYPLADVATSSQHVHWILLEGERNGKGGLNHVKDFFKTVREVVKDGNAFAWNVNHAYSKPVNEDTLGMLMDNHPLRRRYLDIVIEELHRLGNEAKYRAPSPEATPENFKDALRDAGFEPLIAEDVTVPYPFGVVGEYAWCPMLDDFIAVDWEKIGKERKMEIGQKCLWKALEEYEAYVGTSDCRKSEYSTNTQFIARAR